MVQQDALGMTALLVAMRDGPSVPDGWDAVLNLSRSAVQALVHHNWNAGLVTERERSLLWVAPDEADGLHDVIEVKTELLSPVVSLSVADQAVQVQFAIENGTLHYGKAAAAHVARRDDARSLRESGTIAWSPPIPITRRDPLQLAATIPVGVEPLPGRPGFTIALLPPKACLVLSGQAEGIFSIESDNQDLADWLGAHRLSDQLASVVLQEADEAVVLTPATVAARVVESFDGEPLLQILTGSGAGATAPASSAPVPHPGAYDFSVMVSSRTAMTMIASAYNSGTGDIKLVSVPPSEEEPHWFAQVHEPMVFEGSFGRQDGETYFTDHSKLFIRFGGSVEAGLKLFIHIDPDSTIRLELDLAAHYPVGISGTGADQVVGLREGGQSVTANGFYEAIVQPQLETFLTGDIRGDMSRVRMTAISDLVLRDLSLAGHTLEFEVAALPGELLVAGRLIPGA